MFLTMWQTSVLVFLLVSNQSLSTSTLTKFLPTFRLTEFAGNCICLLFDAEVMYRIVPKLTIKRLKCTFPYIHLCFVSFVKYCFGCLKITFKNPWNVHFICFDIWWLLKRSSWFGWSEYMACWKMLEHLYNNVMTNSLSIDISASISNDEVVFILSMVHSTIVGFLSSEWMLKEGGHSTSCLTRLLFLHL